MRGEPASRRDWVLVADQRHCQLLVAHRDDRGRLRLAEQAGRELTFQESEHVRPSPRINKDGHSYASLHNEEREKGLRSARQIVAFLIDELRGRDPKCLRILAPARLMGFLRKKLPDQSPCRVVEHVGEYAGLTHSELARHPVTAEFCSTE